MSTTILPDSRIEPRARGEQLPTNQAPGQGAPANETTGHPLGWAALTAAVVACGWIYRETLAALPRIWDIDPNYSHGYVVPLASLLFAWQAWRDRGAPVHGRVAAGETLAGVIRITCGLVLHVVGVVLGWPLLDVLSLIVVLSGAFIIVGGRNGYAPYAFSIAFLIFMAPLPAGAYQRLAIEMQQIASAASAVLFELFQVPVYREGCFIHLPGYDMEVGAACSGLRQLAAIIALSLAVGQMSGRSRTYKWILGLLSVPIAVVANIIRVTLTGFILLWFGRKWAEGVYHTLEGLAIVGVAAALILLTAWLLAELLPENETAKTKRGGNDNGSSPDPASPASPATGWRLGTRVAVLAGCLVAAIVGQEVLAGHLAAVAETPAVPLREPLASLPLTLGEWRGQDMPIDEEHLYADDHLQRTYVHPGRRQAVSAWVVYSATGADRQHHPEVCMAVAGQPEDLKVRQTLDVPGHPAPIQQYRFGTTGRTQWVFYWHYTLPGEQTAAESALQKFYRRVRHKPSSVTLEVFAPATTDEDLEGAHEFVRLLDAAIQKSLGPGAIRGSQRVPVTVIREDAPAE